MIFNFTYQSGVYTEQNESKWTRKGKEIGLNWLKREMKVNEKEGVCSSLNGLKEVLVVNDPYLVLE